ncbi:MAG: type I-G CRISPR-associated protein Cas8g1/Csx17, partial [Acidimicrobiia bacterium]
MAELILSGCRAEPIGSYLKALGVFRLVAEQLDAGVRGYWVGDTFAVDTAHSTADIESFFLAQYVPTPVVAPWNGRMITALEGGDQDLEAIEASTRTRLGPYREAIVAARKALADARRRGIDPQSRSEKASFIRLCRNWFPELALRWLDAVAVLTQKDAVFPILTGGTGGNLGSGDLTLNFMQQLQHLLREDGMAGKPTVERLRQALWEEGSPRLLDAMIGQFDPGAAGGANVGGKVVNPWDFVLLIEGALVFTSGVARRFGFNQQGLAALPFTVRATSAGYGSSAGDESTKGEVWAPVWRRPTGLTEIGQLITEGRATWRGSQARTALDFARAAGTLGVDRGIEHFVRHSVAIRLGQANLAIPVGRFVVRERRGVPVLGQLDGWLARVRRLSRLSAAITAGLRAVERALLAAADHPSPRELQAVLSAVASLETAVGRSGS